MERGSDVRRREDPFGRGIEARGDQRIEDAVERERDWLSDLGITPETLRRVRKYPALEGSTSEYLIYMLLLGALVEQGGEWDARRKIRVRNLIGIIRRVGYPSMTEREQGSLNELSQSPVLNITIAQSEITPSTLKDVELVWRNFGLKIPQRTTRGVLKIPAFKGKTRVGN